MYDYWKLRIFDDEQIKIIRNNKLFEFNAFVGLDTGVCQINNLVANYKNWEIIWYSEKLLEIRGSIHKYWNGGTNENDFTFSNIKTALADFCTLFNLKPELAKVVNLEFGVNVKPKLNASDIINSVICFKDRSALRPYDFRPDATFIEFEFDNYFIKIYDKGKQYKTDNTLRVEEKARCNKHLEFAGVYNLNDLLNETTFKVLGCKLDKIFDCIVLDDISLDLWNLTKKERKIYKEYSNPRKWYKKENVSSTISYKKRQFKKIVDTKGDNKIYTYLRGLIHEKWNYLLNH